MAYMSNGLLMLRCIALVLSSHMTLLVCDVQGDPMLATATFSNNNLPCYASSLWEAGA